MIRHAPTPTDSPGRLAALHRTRLLDTPAEAAFDRVTRMAARLLGAPVAFISLVDRDRQFLKSVNGVPEPWAARRTAALAFSFAHQVVGAAELVLITDARRDPLTRQNVTVRELGWVAYLGMPLVTRGGYTIGAMSVVDTIPRLWSERDIELLRDLAAAAVTEIEYRTELAERRAEHEEPFADPFTDAGAGVAVLSVDGRWLRLNRAFGELLGVDPAELVGAPVAAVTHPDDVATEQEELRRLRTGKRASYQLEKRFRHRTGTTVWALVTVTVVRRADNEPDHLVVVAQDITDRKQMTGGRESEVVRDWDLAGDGMCWLGESAAVFGYEPGALGSTAAGWYERLHAEDRERVVAGIAEAVARGDRAWTDEYRFRRADGTYVHVRDRAVLTYDEDGSPSRCVAAMVEVDASGAERPDAADHLRQMQKMEAIGQLAGGIAHDFNNLLTGILSYCDLILPQLRDGDPIRGDIDQIRHAGQRAAVLTRQLLAFSRRQILQPRVLSLNNVVDDLDGMLRRVLGSSIGFDTHLEPKLWHVFADPSQVEQVLVNLIVNARDAILATPAGPMKGGRVAIATANVCLDASSEPVGALGPGEYVVLTVSDTGVGMDQATQARIFEPFFTTKAQGKGTGLGLASVYGFVQQSGGEVAVESSPDNGAAFHIYLPRHAGAADTASPVGQGATAGRSEILLLVEDEPAVRGSARRLLEHHGYTVLEAQNGAEALRLFETNEPRVDLILTDVMMPEMDGRELVERLRARQPALKVLFMSGYTEKAIANDGVMPPNTGFVEKPFTVDSLMRGVRALLDSSASR